MSPKALLLSAIAAIPMSLPLAASAGDFSITAGASSLGYQVEPAYRLSDHWGLRMPIAAGDYDFEGEAGDRHYSGELKSNAMGLLADYRPFAGGLRVSGGLIHTDYRASVISEDIRFGNGETTRIYANIEQDRNISPMVLVGYDARIGPANITASAGGIFTNGFRVNGGQTGPGADDVDTEAELDKIRNELRDLKSVPYVSLGVSFAF